MKKTLMLAIGLCLLTMLLTGCYNGGMPAVTPTIEPTDEPTLAPTETPTATPEPTATPAPTASVEPTQPPVQAEVTQPYFILPEGYTIGDPLPIYAAVRGNYQERLDPYLFTDAEMISDDTHYNGLVYVRYAKFADGGYFGASEDNYSFDRYMDTTNWKTDLRGEVMRLAEFARRANHEPADIVPLTLEKETLAGITLADARAEFEAMLQKTASGEWVMEAALDMDEARIHAMGEAYNEEQRYWNGKLNQGRDYSDYSRLTEEDECYYLEYRYLVNGLPMYFEYDWSGAEALMSADGMERIDVHVKYLTGEEIKMPDRLFTPQEIMEILPQGMRKYRFGGKLHSVISLELVYSVQEDDTSPTGYAMVPAWYIIYLDNGAAKQGYTCTAVFSAVDGAMLQSMFDERPGG